MSIEYVLYWEREKGEGCACQESSEDYLRVDGVLFCPKCAAEKWNRERDMPGVLNTMDNAVASLETQEKVSICAADRCAELVVREIERRGLKLVARNDEPDFHHFIVSKP
jgi:hypothetical protein